MSDTYEDERTFEPLPPAPGRGFAVSWWGQAWLKALEDTALDGQQLKKGRRFAREGAVGAVTVRPGRITAVVRGRDGSRHRSDVLLQELDAAAWDRFLEMAAERAGHIAALLDREMPPHLVEDAATAGVELLPAIGDLEPACTCDAWDHCPHTAALCYQVARLLDQDPFVLLLMRGRTERALLDSLQELSAAPCVSEPTAVEGVPAQEAFAARDIVPPLPAPPTLPPEPDGPAHLDTETAPEPGVDPAALEFLAAHAAARAHRILADALAKDHQLQPVEPTLTVDQDTVRLAADCLDRRISARLAACVGAATRRPGGGRTRLATGRGRFAPRAGRGVDSGDGGAGAGRRGPRPRLARGRAPGAAGDRRQPVDGDRPGRPTAARPGRPVVALPQGARTLGRGGSGRPGSGGGAGVDVRRCRGRARRLNRRDRASRRSPRVRHLPSDPGQQSAGEFRRESTRQLRWQ